MFICLIEALEKLFSYSYLPFSTSTTLEISSGLRPERISSSFPASLWSASNLILLPIWNLQKLHGRKLDNLIWELFIYVPFRFHEY